MPVESATYISDLVATNPIGATDPLSSADDHLRLIKAAILATFPQITGEVSLTHTELNLLDGLTADAAELNNLDGVTGKTGTGNVVLSASPTFTGTVGAAAITATGTITGNALAGAGGSITGLSGSNIASGTVADARLSSNVPLKNAANTFTANQQITYATGDGNNGGLSFTEPGVYSVFFRAFSNSTTSPPISNGLTAAHLAIWTEGSSGLSFGTSGAARLNISSSGNFDFKGGTVTTANASASEVGYKGVPQNSQFGSPHTAALTDAGKHIFMGGNTFTIPANASTAFPVGTVLTIINGAGGGACTIAITSDTLRLAGTATTGSRTLAENGIATAIKISSTIWIISGAGLS